MRSYHIFRTWAPEASAIALAVGLVASIARVLTVRNGKPVPDWGDNFNLNALLALLSTILRALLVIIVAQIISQRKWDWYSVKNARSLADLQQFDSGSRGAYGALLLIPTVLSKDLVTLAAAVVLLISFLVGPSVQQASGTTPCSFNSSGIDASLPFAHWVPSSGSYSYPMAGSEAGAPTPDLIAAILSSVVSPHGIENEISTSCATGNCTFGDLLSGASEDTTFNDDNRTTHSSVGVCNMCTNVASLVTINSTTAKKVYSLPSGLNITTDTSMSAIMQPTPDLKWMGGLLIDRAREASRWAYVNATLLSVRSDPITASVCSLYPCLRTYSSIIKDNHLRENETQSDVMQIQLTKTNYGDPMSLNARSNVEFDYASVKSPCQIEEHTFHMGDTLPDGIVATDLQLLDFSNETSNSTNITWPEQCIYRQGAEFVRAIATVMNADIFDGNCQTWKRFTCSKNPKPGESSGDANESYLSGVGVNAVLRSLVSYENSTIYPSATSYFDAVANAMTNRFRFQYGSAVAPNSSSDISPLGLVHGTVWETKVCVSMRKAWLLFPICLTLITSILSIWTIITNWQRRHSVPVWKESILPLLFYGQNIKPQDSKALPMQPFGKDVGEDNTEGLMEASTMAVASRDIMVTFQWSDNEKTGELDDQVMSSTASLLGQDSIPLTRRDSRGSSVVHGH